MWIHWTCAAIFVLSLSHILEFLQKYKTDNWHLFKKKWHASVQLPSPAQMAPWSDTINQQLGLLQDTLCTLRQSCNKRQTSAISTKSDFGLLFSAKTVKSFNGKCKYYRHIGLVYFLWPFNIGLRSSHFSFVQPPFFVLIHTPNNRTWKFWHFFFHHH